MTYAGFFVHLNDIPPVLRWLQWLCPLKYTLEALAVNEAGSGLMVVDSLDGVPVEVSAVLIMKTVSGERSLRARTRIVALMQCCGVAAVRVRREQLLQGRARTVRVYRDLRGRRSVHCVVQGPRAAVSSPMASPGIQATSFLGDLWGIRGYTIGNA